MAELRALGDIGGEQRESLTFMVLVGGREGALVDMVGQEAMEGVLKGGEGCLVIRVQDRSLMFVQMLQEAVGGVRPHMGGEGQGNCSWTSAPSYKHCRGERCQPTSLRSTSPMVSLAMDQS